MELSGIEVLFEGTNFSRLMGGLWVSVKVSALALLIGVPAGVALGALRTVPNRMLDWALRLYLEFFRIVPTLVVLFLAAMQNIPADLYESARLDGASRWQEFRDITIPGIRPTLVFMILMTAIWSFLTFDYIWILTQGGPAGASEVLSVLVFKQAFQAFRAGYASAIGLTMSILVGFIIGLFGILRRRGWEI